MKDKSGYDNVTDENKVSPTFGRSNCYNQGNPKKKRDQGKPRIYPMKKVPRGCQSVHDVRQRTGVLVAQSVKLQVEILGLLGERRFLTLFDKIRCLNRSVLTTLSSTAIES
jgi:hypothetical protein